MSRTRNILAGAMISALAMGAFAMDAQAGGGHKHRHFHGFNWGVHYIYKSHGCWWFKKRYHKTGRYFWLKKYRECRYGDDD
jgi:hypothetical protein